MAIYFAPGLVVSPPPGLEPHFPIVLWDSVVTTEGLSSTSATSDDPVTNLANGGTDNVWTSASTAEQTITVATSGDGLVEVVGIAQHNLGSTGCSVALEGKSAVPGAVFETLLEETLLGSDLPALLRIEAAYVVELRLRLKPAGAAPSIGVLMAGPALTLGNGIEVGHTPITDGQDVTLINGYSQGSHYLGSIVVGESNSSDPSLRLIDPDYYAQSMRPWVQAANRGAPFFYAWDPAGAPNDVGYCWLRSAARPVVNHRTGEYDLTLSIEGMA